MSETTQQEPQQLDVDSLFEEMYAEAGGEVPEKAEEPEQVQPLAEPEVEEAAPAAAETQEEPEEAPDIWAEATPAQKQAWAELQKQKASLEHSVYSNSGRVSALQKKLNDLEVQLARQQEQAEAAPKAPEPSTEDTSEGFNLKEFQDDYPDVYRAMTALQKRELGQAQQQYEAKLKVLEEKFSRYSGPIEEMEAEREQAHRVSQLQALSAVHPDWQNVSSSPDFAQWLQGQSPGIQSLVQSTAAEDNIVLLNLYKGANSAPAPQPVAQPQARQPLVERQPQPAIPRTASAARPQQGIHPSDEDAAWAYFSEKVYQQ